MSAIADLIGEENARKLSDVAGGTRFVVPLDLIDGIPPHCIVKRVGHDLALLLILHFGGTILYVPTGTDPRNVRQIDVRKVARLTKRKLTANDIAKRLGCSERTVTAKRAEARSAGLLPPLNSAEMNGVRYDGK